MDHKLLMILFISLTDVNSSTFYHIYTL